MNDAIEGFFFQKFYGISYFVWELLINETLIEIIEIPNSNIIFCNLKMILTSPIQVIAMFCSWTTTMALVGSVNFSMNFLGIQTFSFWNSFWNNFIKKILYIFGIVTRFSITFCCRVLREMTHASGTCVNVTNYYPTAVQHQSLSPIIYQWSKHWW